MTGDGNTSILLLVLLVTLFTDVFHQPNITKALLEIVATTTGVLLEVIAVAPYPPPFEEEPAMRQGVIMCFGGQDLVDGPMGLSVFSLAETTAGGVRRTAGGRIHSRL